MDVAKGMKEHHVLYRFGLVKEWNKKSSARYRKVFSSDDGVLLGEWTPYYMRSPWTANVARVVLPEESPILVLLRDPIDRFASALRHDMDIAVRRYRKHLLNSAVGKEEKVNRFFPRPLRRIPEKLGNAARAEALYEEVANASSKWWVAGPPGKKPHTNRAWIRYVGSDAIWGGMYNAQLNAWTSIIPKERFIVIQYEKLRRDPQHYANLVWERLGLDPVPLKQIDRPSQSASRVLRWKLEDHPDVVAAIRAAVRADAELLPQAWDIDLSLWKRTMGEG